MKRKRKTPVQRAARRRAGAMLKSFQAQVFESKKDKARRKTRLKGGENARQGW